MVAHCADKASILSDEVMHGVSFGTPESILAAPDQVRYCEGGCKGLVHLHQMAEKGNMIRSLHLQAAAFDSCNEG